MVAIKRILCPVDTSAFSRRALQYAVAIAPRWNAEVVVLSVRPVVPAPAMWLDYPGTLPYNPFPTREAEELRVRSFVRDAVGSVVSQVFVRDGSPVPEILQTARDLPADLIVMGTHGLSGFEHWLLGSVTEKVLRKAPCPVVTVPPAPAEPETLPTDTFRTILCGIDFSADSRAIIDRALSLTPEAGGRLVLVHVLEQFSGHDTSLTTHFDVEEFRRAFEVDARKRLEAMIPPETRGRCEVEFVVAHGKASREILRVAEAYRADLIVLGVHGRNAFDLALFGSTTQNVLHRAHTAVVTVPREVKAAAAAA